MKKIIYLALIVLLGFSCRDFNEDNFDGYEDLEKPKNIASYEYTFDPSTDVKIIVDVLNSLGDDESKAMAVALNADKMFSDAAPADRLIPILLQKKYYSADVNSSAGVTYPFKTGRSEELAKLTNATIYTLDADDYASVWGAGSTTSYLTPANPPASVLPAILAGAFSNPSNNMIVNLEYRYADKEPSGTTVTLISEDFEEYNVDDLIESNGWTSFSETGTRNWQAKQYSGNKYAQMSNGSSGQNIAWIISPQIDLGTTKGYDLTFDVTVGYWRASCLQVLLSTDPNAALDPANVTWTDITSNFDIPEEPASGYGVMGSAGKMNMDAYSGDIYIAFKYVGNADTDPQQTTTYQIDNFSIAYNSDSTVPYSSNSMYYYTNNQWRQYPNVVMPNGKDYEEMGVTYLSTSSAPNYIPGYLRQNYVYAQDGQKVVVVYRTSSTAYYADEYEYSQAADKWTVNSFVETITEQYVYANVDGVKKWIFDPSFIIQLDKDGFQIVVDYVRDNIYDESNPNILDSRGNAEFYYGFNAYYPNVTYREIDRVKDNTYPLDASDADKVKFMNERTIEALKAYLSIAYANAQPKVNGVDQKAKITFQIYSEPEVAQRVNWTYTFRCVGEKEWVFEERTGDDGRHEEAE